ncbi:Hsp20/alpha crystallin family protein [Synechococcus sp. CS-1328]|uniref:Hsp20/alpha crystallin family protein n=1 Tax=Synechococcus sp. CS-1328 TaxID=2847976 RepID=UPI00223A9402|nr:Hsp20/alpha crystallin family protein [Synechococcus sp. CS-1328]MCT0224244.1 Hsp20/alpha crystallin family protein [Synechococcus sp. CS-1328]
MLSLRTSSPYGLIDRLEQQLNQQLNQQLPTTEHVPAAEVHQTETAYTVVLELPGVDKTAIDVKATDRTLVISAERRSSRDLAAPVLSGESRSEGQTDPGTEPTPAPLLSEFRYGTWSRSFRFPVAIERDQLEATYRDGLLTVTAPKANKVSTVTVKVAG